MRPHPPGWNPRSTVVPAFALIAIGLASSFAPWAGPDAFIEVDRTDPEECLDALRRGNARYRAGHRTFAHLDHRRIVETAEAQAPFAVFLSCSDSRVPVEHLFDVGIGDLFVIRVAGNVVADHEEASIEYAVDHLGTPIVVILGHSRCGAVTAVVEHAELEGHIPHLSEHIVPPFEAARAARPDAARDELIADTVERNVRQAIADLLDNSIEIRSRVEAGRVRVVGAIYDLETGRVDWLDDPAATVALD